MVRIIGSTSPGTQLRLTFELAIPAVSPGCLAPSTGSLFCWHIPRVPGTIPRVPGTEHWGTFLLALALPAPGAWHRVLVLANRCLPKGTWHLLLKVVFFHAAKFSLAFFTSVTRGVTHPAKTSICPGLPSRPILTFPRSRLCSVAISTHIVP